MTTTTTTPTAHAERERLAAAGADEEVIAAVLRLTAPARHRARVVDTLSAALSQATDPERVDELVQAVMAGELVQDDDDDDDDSECLGVAWAVITLDVGGRGGRAGVEGTDPDGRPVATARMPWARGLGSGRWFARDGGAYLAAAREALYLLERVLGGPVLMASAEPYPALVVRVGGRRDIARLPVEHMEALVEGAAWVYAYAVRQLATDDDDTMHDWAVVANTARSLDRSIGPPH